MLTVTLLHHEQWYNSAMVETLSLQLLGVAHIQRGGKPVTSLRRKSKALLAYLVVTGVSHSRQALSDRFCAASDDPARALRWHLSDLRRQLGPQSLLADAATVQINRQMLWADVWAFEDTLLAAAAAETAVLPEILSLYRGDLLTGLTLSDAPEFELWLLGERARFQFLYEKSLLHLVNRLIDQGDYETAVPWAQRLAQTAPLLEEGHVRLIWLYGKTGQRQAALAQYEQCCTILRRELAVEPTPEVTAVYEAVRRHAETPLRPKPALSHSADATPIATLVGREAEVAALRQVWRQAQAGQGSLLLIEAEAGMGKTRLAQVLWPEAGRVIVGRSYELSQPLPYIPWIEALETLLADKSLLAVIDAFWREQLARLLPSLLPRLGTPTSHSAVGHGEVEQLWLNMGFKELPKSRQAQAKGLCPVCEHYGQTRRIPDKLVTFLAKSRDVDAAMTLAMTKTLQWCWYALHENHLHLRRGHIHLENG